MTLEPDWMIANPDDSAIMNLCVVSKGTYEVCSRTVTPQQQSPHQHGENAKWILHVVWKMEGVDMHFDTSIGRQFFALDHTLTGLTGSEEEEEDPTANRRPNNGAADSAVVPPPSKQIFDGRPGDAGLEGARRCRTR